MSIEPKVRGQIENYFDVLISTERLEQSVESWELAQENGILIDSIKSAVIGEVLGKLVTFSIAMAHLLSEIKPLILTDVVRQLFLNRYPQLNHKLNQILNK